MARIYAIVGMSHRPPEAAALLASLPDGEPITLVREPENRFDRRAVQVWARGVHLGYVPRAMNANLSARIDSLAGAGAMATDGPATMPGILRLKPNRPPTIEVADPAVTEGRPL